jgi:hypothetical protein
MQGYINTTTKERKQINKMKYEQEGVEYESRRTQYRKKTEW